jgi:hypothetical protein
VQGVCEECDIILKSVNDEGLGGWGRVPELVAGSDCRVVGGAYMLQMLMEVFDRDI